MYAMLWHCADHPLISQYLYHSERASLPENVHHRLSGVWVYQLAASGGDIYSGRAAKV